MESGLSLLHHARITTAGDPAVSPGIDGQEEEQTAGYRDAPRPGTIASTPCSSLTMRKRSTPHLSKPGHAETRPDVQHALFLAWHAANRICAKRLMPFLPTLVEATSAA